MRWVTMPWHVLVTFFSSIGSVFSSWWGKRNLRYLLQGIPSLLVFVGIVVLAQYCFFQDQTVLAQSYTEKARGSLAEASSLGIANKDATKPLAMAQTCYHRLTYLPSDKTENRYWLAISNHIRSQLAQRKISTTNEKLQNARDDEKEALQKELDMAKEEYATMSSAAFRLMNGLAPSNRRGYGRAHLWQFEQLYRLQPGPDGKPVPPTLAAYVEAERHLLHALEYPDESVKMSANFGLARLYRDANRIEDAKRHMAEVAAVFPEYRLVLAQWAKIQNDNESAMGHAKAAEGAFRKRLNASQDDHEARLNLIDCFLIQTKYQEAQDLISNGATLSSNQEQLIQMYRRKQTWLLLVWSDAKEKDPRSTFDERLTMLDQAMAIDPNNPELFQRLLKLTKEKTPEAEKARELFRKHKLSKGSDSPMAELFLGLDAWQQDNAAEARFHWEKAFKLSSGAPLIANNLAWVLAFYPPVDLPRALDMVNAAVDKAPNEPRFRGTRGQILAKMGRHQDALPDLQEAIKAYPKDPNLFKVLSETCEKLGFTKMAADYKARAEELTGTKGGATLDPAGGTEKKADVPNVELKAPPAAPPKTEPKTEPKPPGGSR
jgi:tetratricopeptide (TPR) repeat protein